MIDYDKTIEKFFASVDAYLEKAKIRAADKDELASISANQEKVRKVAAGLPETADYRVRYNRNIVVGVDGFMKPNSQDNRAFLAFRGVFGALEKYYEDIQNKWTYKLDDDKRVLLNALKKWNYVTSTNIMKDFIFPFKSPESFAEHVNMGKQK